MTHVWKVEVCANCSRQMLGPYASCACGDPEWVEVEVAASEFAIGVALTQRAIERKKEAVVSAFLSSEPLPGQEVER